MSSLFMAVPGSVQEFQEDYTLPGRILLRSGAGADLSTSAGAYPLFLVSGIDYKQSVDAQFQTSMERDIYAYVFGDNIGEAIIQGRAIWKCRERGASMEISPGEVAPDTGGQLDDWSMRTIDASTERTGLDDLMDLYTRYRMSVEPDYLILLVGTRTIKGYLTSMLIRAVGLSDEPAGLVYDFSMTLSALPQSSQKQKAAATSGWMF